MAYKLLLTLFFLWLTVPRFLFSSALNIISTFCFPPSLRNLLKLVSLDALTYFPGCTTANCCSLSSLFWGWVSMEVTVVVDDCMLPFFTSRPARRAVCSIHSDTILIEALWTVSVIWVGRNSGSGRTCDRACRGNARRRYCPLAFEKSAAKNNEYSEYEPFL